MSGEQPGAADGGLRDDFVVWLQPSSGICFFNAIGTQLRRSLRYNRRSSSMDDEAALRACEQRERSQRMANRSQSFGGEGVLESAFAGIGYGHAHRVVPLINVNRCSGDAAAKRTGQKCRNRTDFFGGQRISDG